MTNETDDAVVHLIKEFQTESTASVAIDLVIAKLTEAFSIADVLAHNAMVQDRDFAVALSRIVDLATVEAMSLQRKRRIDVSEADADLITDRATIALMRN